MGVRVPPFAPSVRAIRHEPFRPFCDRVLNGASAFIAKAMDDIRHGDILILDGAWSPAHVVAAKDAVCRFGAATPAEARRILDGAPDFHEINDGSQAPPGGYVAIDHSYYFFRWNGDGLGLFASLADAWAMLKLLSGHSSSDFETNLPSQGVIDRIQVIQYPRGGGRITTHADPAVYVTVNCGLYLTTFGEQYEHGGFYALDGHHRPMAIDPQIRAGSIVLWSPARPHGVAPVDPDLPLDWTRDDGRWFLALNTVESHHVVNRHTALPVPESL